MPTSKKRNKRPSSGPSRSGLSTRPGGPRRASGAAVPPKAQARVRKAGFGDWIRAARPATLGLSIAPIPVGYGAAVLAGEAHPTRTLLALAVSVLLQLGVNFANDYSDGIRGTDAHRVGPARLVGSGMAKPRTVLIVALLFFLLAAAAGFGIVLITGYWWLLAVGAVAILAAWFYTGGKVPYGYFGLGEIMVFVFFGLVAVLGTTWINAGTLTLEAWMGAVGIGAIAMAVLVANNLRDIDQDRAARKFTLSVIIGRVASRILFILLVLVVPFTIVYLLGLIYTGVNLAFFAVFAAIPACIVVIWGRTASELVLALKLASSTALLYGVLVGSGFAFAFSGI